MNQKQEQLKKHILREIDLCLGKITIGTFGGLEQGTLEEVIVENFVSMHGEIEEWLDDFFNKKSAKSNESETGEEEENV